ncbi:MAG: signal peptidase II [Candidatus Ancillula sp.]|jgi:signal peptidase II|nr:signal peptidase II [Candidatus Ancillula sp.]
MLNQEQNKFNLFSKHFKLKLSIIWVVFVLIDILSKIYAQFYSNIKIVYNSGVALSLFSKINVDFILLLIQFGFGLVVFGFLFISKIQRGLIFNFSLILISSGAAGNGINRIINNFANKGFVVTDFIYYPNLFTGNIADIFVVAGVILFACFAIKDTFRV